MTGRRAIFGAAAVGLLTCVLVLAAPASPTRAGPPATPNVVVVITDDQTARQFSQEAMPRTRQIVAEGGTKFPNYLVSTAECCPSRASMLTGQYGHNNGVLSNHDGYGGMSDPDNTLPVWLQRAGYNTSHVGKFLNGYRQATHTRGAAPGWERWHTVFGSTYYDYDLADSDGHVKARGHRKRDYVTTVLNRIASKQARSLGRKDAPFFLQLDHRAPHTESGQDSGGRCGGIALPAPGDGGLFENAHAPRVPSYNEADVSDKPPFVRRLKRLNAQDKTGLDKRWGCGLATAREIDRGVAEIARVLRSVGELDDTVIAFTSDNGVFYGEHRVFKGKVVPYAPDHNVPFAMRVPRKYLIGGRVGHVGKMVSNIDLAPTIVDLAGAEPCRAPADCRAMDGRSLVPLIQGSGPWPNDRAIAYEYDNLNAGRYPVCTFTGLWSKSVKLTHYTRVANGGGGCTNRNIFERYNLDSDPDELRNDCAHGCPAGGGQSALEARLSDLEVCAGIAGRDPLPPSGEYCE